MKVRGQNVGLGLFPEDSGELHEEIAGTVQRSNEIRNCYPLPRRIICTAGVRGPPSRRRPRATTCRDSLHPLQAEDVPFSLQYLTLIDLKAHLQRRGIE